jgi:hypothetical protein
MELVIKTPSAKSSELAVDENWTIFAQSRNQAITHIALTAISQVYQQHLPL